MNSNKETKDKELEEFARELEKIFESIPAGRLDEEPRFQLTGEIMPESLLNAEQDMSYSELP